MGIDVSPELIIGKEFNNEQEAKEWVLGYLGKDEEWFESEWEGDFYGLLQEGLSSGLYGQDYSAYSRGSYYIGFEPDLSDRTGQDVAECWRKAVELFGEDARVHFWARYW